MKIIAFILILLLTAMIVAPCGDTVTMDSAQPVQINEANIADAISPVCSAYEHQESCSAMCPCQCCPSIDGDTEASARITTVTPPKIVLETQLMLASVYYDLIWSPPKLFT